MEAMTFYVTSALGYLCQVSVFVLSVITYRRRKEFGFLLMAIAFGVIFFGTVVQFALSAGVHASYGTEFTLAREGGSITVSVLSIVAWTLLAFDGKRRPNKSPLRTPASVTPAADAPAAPPPGAAGL